MSKKRKAPDISQDVELDHTTIKCCLVKHLKEKRLQPVIERWVRNLSQIAQRGSHIFNHYLIWCIEHGHPLVLDKRLQTLIRNCFTLGTGARESMFPSLNEFWREKHTLYGKTPERIPGDWQAITYLSNQYMTNFTTYLSHTMESRQKKYIKEWFSKEKFDDECYDIETAINSWNRVQRTNILQNEDVLNFVREQQETLGYTNGQMISWKKERIQGNTPMAKWIKKHLIEIVRYQHRMLCFFENANKKTYSLAPVMSVCRHFMTIDMTVLYDMMRECSLVRDSRIDFNKMYKEHFESVFACERFSSKIKHGWKFRIIQTDGIAACFHFERERIVQKSDLRAALSKKQKSQTKDYVIHDKEDIVQRVIAIDPGRNVLICGLEEKEDGGKKIYRYTRKQYYFESHVRKNNKKIERRNKQIENILIALTAVTKKTRNIDKFEEYLRVHLVHYDAYWDHALQRRHSLLRMDNFIHKKKAIDRFFNALCQKGERKPIIAYGDGDFPCTGRNENPVPVKWIKEQCKRRYKTVEIDEFLTTRCCNQCGQHLGDFRREGNLVRGLKWCASHQCSKTRFVSRDVNAAMNILLCFKMIPERPEFLRRPL
eukprot:764319-Hanusia_phi.AAC.2